MTNTIFQPASVLPRRQRRISAANKSLMRAGEKFKLPILLVLAHIPLGILLYNAGRLALLHPVIVILFGLRRAYRREERLEQVAIVVVYLVGSEILWRMANLPIFWETGKYASAAIMIVALVRRSCWKIPTLPLLYLLFLLPACFLTLFKNDFEDARQMISFNMSGPILLFAGCWFCSHLKINPQQLKTIFITLIIPLASVAFTTLFYTVTAEEIIFNTESNHTTSGGFGPNQVSAMLGLGAFFCIASYLLFKNRFQDFLFLCVFTVLFTAQSAMTFSRGGMYNALGAAAAVALLQLLNPAEGLKRLLPVVLAGAIFLLVVFPLLNDFTGGKLEERFEETDATNRGSIVLADFEIFSENPFFGTGVGESFFQYERILEHGTASHTEFARVVAEHGLFGLFALVCLFLMFAQNLSRQPSSAGKAMVAGLVVWSSLFMLNAGMRLAAPAFVLGLSCLTLRNFSAQKRNL